MRTQKGFTLMELMISVALVAILMAVAIPNYQRYTTRADRADAQATLAAAATAMERYKSQRFSYSGATAGEPAVAIVPNRSPTASAAGQQKYNITLTFPGGASTFLITAISTSRLDGSKSEVLTINQAGVRCYRPLESGSPTTCDPATHSAW